MALYEERRVILNRGRFGDFRRLVHGTLWPALSEAGARPLCLLNGLIGATPEETYLFTGFPTLEAWQEGQRILTGVSPEEGVEDGAMRARAELIAEESARLLLPSEVRPKAETPAGDRRAVYGMRRFWIAPGAWPAFVVDSAEGIWPRIESQGARILGLFRDAAVTEPLEVTLLTGYDGPAHWEATRETDPGFEELSPELREASRRARAERQARTLRSYVRLMSAHWPA